MFNDIKFDRKNHTYTLNGKALTPTTELISKLEREVDWNEKARGVALKLGIDVKTIRKQWKDKGETAAKKGTEVHKYIERRLRHNTEKDTLFPEMIAFDSFWTKAKEKMSPVQIEMIIGDYDLGIGGTIDTLFYSTQSNKHHIFDYKTNEKFTQNNSWQTLKEPFDDLEDCHLIKYSLQLSVYKLILKRNTDIVLGDSFIVWLGEDYQVIKVLDFTDRLEDYIINCLLTI